jgi:hypothetical protein
MFKKRKIRIRVRCSGAIEVHGLDKDGYLDVGRWTLVWSIIRLTGLTWRLGLFLPVWVNGELARKTRRLRDGDEITLMLPMFGG